MTADIAAAAAGWQVALPAIMALCAAFVVMLADLAMRGTERDGVAVVGILGLAATVVVAYRWASDAPEGQAGRRWRHGKTLIEFAALGFAIPLTIAALAILFYVLSALAS